MWVTKVAKAVLWLSCCAWVQPVVAEGSVISTADFCNQYASSCLAGQTPSLPFLVIKNPQGHVVVSKEQWPELYSDDPELMLPALQRLLTAQPEHSALFFLPANSNQSCLPCRLWLQAVSDWQKDNTTHSLQLIEVDSGL